MKTTKIIYWISTGLLSALLLMSAGMYIFNNAEIQTTFENLGFPTFIIYPLAIAKIIGVVVLLMPKPTFLKDMAYSAIFFNILLAFGAHVNVGDDEQMGAVIAFILLATSFITYRKMNK
ncbi:MAG: DoxX family protein [Crocinitomicaceae bacterium]